MTDERVYFANGTSALIASLRALGAEGKDVVLPACVCPSVPAAVLAAGCTLRLADIEPDRLGLDPEGLGSLLAGAGAVIAVHAAGNPCRIAEIATICQSHDVPLIEDCAQAEGSDSDGRQTGSFGDVAVFSYGSGKILELDGGGGAAWSSNNELRRRLAIEAQTMPEQYDVQAGEDMSRIYKFFYNSFFPARLPGYAYVFRQLFAETGRRLQGRADPGLVQRVATARAGLPERLDRRRKLDGQYRRLLGTVPRITLLPRIAGAAPWRFNLWLEPSLRDRALKHFLASGIPVSSWYPDIGLFLGETGPRPNAAWLGAGILNLWLDDAASEADIADWSHHLLLFLAEQGALS